MTGRRSRSSPAGNRPARPQEGPQGSTPLIRTVPPVGTWSPPRIVSRVLFPAPDSP